MNNRNVNNVLLVVNGLKHVKTLGVALDMLTSVPCVKSSFLSDNDPLSKEDR